MRLLYQKFEIAKRSLYKLDAMIEAAARVGNPEFGRKTILVAGTNGKGSVCQYISSLAKSAGLNVGTYISPHVKSRTERIQINGKPISESLLLSYEKKYATVLKSLSYFEQITLLAFLIFRDKKVDLQVLEVGLGGRFDATNISTPDFSVIMPIDLDHQEILGATLEEIALEKAGVMRKGRPVISSYQDSKASRILKKAAKASGARLEMTKPLKVSFLRKIEIERGLHQRQNAETALFAFKHMQKEWKLKLSAAAIQKALLVPLYPARIQVVRKNPLVIVDGAHNPHALRVLKRYLSTHYSRVKFNVIFGLMREKDARAAVEELKTMTNSVSLMSFYPEREFSPQALKRYWKKYALETPVEIFPSLKKALRSAWRSNEPLLIAGSFYLAGPALEELDRLKKFRVKK